MNWPASGIASGATVIAAQGGLIENAGEMLKKTFPTASTLMRALATVAFGSVTTAMPLLGTLSAITDVVKVAPASVDSVILTLAVLTTPVFVPAVFGGHGGG